jgi:hypothetical protein
MKQPTAGRIVNYFPNNMDQEAQANGATVIPALIIQVFDSMSGAVNLRAFPDSDDILSRQSVPHRSRKTEDRGYWAWPEMDQPFGGSAKLTDTDRQTDRQTDSGVEDMNDVFGITLERAKELIVQVQEAFKLSKSMSQIHGAIKALTTDDNELNWCWLQFGIAKNMKDRKYLSGPMTILEMLNSMK